MKKVIMIVAVTLFIAGLITSVGCGVKIFTKQQVEDEKTRAVETAKVEWEKKAKTKCDEAVKKATESLKAQPGAILHDPTYQEWMDFIAEDKTNKRKAVDAFDTWTFAPEVRKNALKQGIRCFLVIVRTPDFTQILLMAETTDKKTDDGKSYIEALLDKEVTVRIGEGYFSQNNWKTKDNDIILSVTVLRDID